MFSESMRKFIEGQGLSFSEKEELSLSMERIDIVQNLVNSWIVPGSHIVSIPELNVNHIFVPSGEIDLGTGSVGNGFSGVRIGYPAFTYNGQDFNIAGVNNDVLEVGIRASDGFLVAGGGNIEISQSGIVIIENGSQSFLDFYSSDRTKHVSLKYATGSMQIQNLNVDGSLSFYIRLTDTSTPYTKFEEDAAQSNRTYLQLLDGVQGSRFVMGAGAKIDLRTEGSSGGSTFARFLETSNTPPNPGAGDSVHIYMKGDKVVFQYNDGGTIRYKYLDLTGTGVTWVHTTVAP